MTIYINMNDGDSDAMDKTLGYDSRVTPRSLCGMCWGLPPSRLPHSSSRLLLTPQTSSTKTRQDMPTAHTGISRGHTTCTVNEIGSAIILIEPGLRPFSMGACTSSSASASDASSASSPHTV